MINNKVSNTNTSTNTNITQSINSKATTSAVANSNSTINSTAGLEKGQVVRGEVVDIKYNEVGIKLEDGRILAGKLDDAIKLSIGDKVSFQVEDVSLKNLVLKIVSESQTMSIQSTIDKALEAAGLGKTKLNQSIVKELLNQQMPVDKKTISLLIQQSLSNKTIPVSTLALINKLHIPVTKDNISLFESFINKNNNIIKEISNLAEQIPELFSFENSDSTEANLLQSKELLNLLLKDVNSEMPNNIATKNNEIFDANQLKSGNLIDKNVSYPVSDKIANSVMNETNISIQQNIDELNSKNSNSQLLTGNFLSQAGNTNTQLLTENFLLKEGSTNSQLLTDNFLSQAESTNSQMLTDNFLSQAGSTNSQLLIGNILSPTERITLVRFINDTPELKTLFSEELLSTLNNGTAEVSEIGSLLNQSIESSDYNSSFIQNLLEQVPSASTILSEYQTMQYQDHSIGTFLSQDERTNLIHILDNLSLPKDLKNQIQSGSISSNDLLKWISSNLDSASDTAIKDLFSSKEFKSLTKETLLDQWTFNPQSIKEIDMDKHFQNLANQTNELKEYIEQTQKGLHENVIKQATTLQENTSFVKTINDIFTYIPLPLKLQNQNAHGELYVYTKKKSGRTAEDGISVLLHLDMDNLGPMDIHINLKGNNIISKFYFDDSKTAEFIQTNINQLENVLERKGYSINTEILMREKDINIVEEFINQDSSSGSLSRYNFDVRA